MELSKKLSTANLSKGNMNLVKQKIKLGLFSSDEQAIKYIEVLERGESKSRKFENEEKKKRYEARQKSKNNFRQRRKVAEA